MSVYKIIFSPTGGTDRVSIPFTQVFQEEVQTVDLTDFTIDFSHIRLSYDDICIVAVPSFGGRVPKIAAERLAEITANDAKAILIVAYGNRAYDDTLLELKSILGHSGFCIVAAVAAVAEHSIMHQFAQGRPDDKDLKELSQFAKRIRQRIEENRISKNLSVPGHRPYREYNGIPIKPVTKKNCTDCGLCSQKCPVQAISLIHPSKTNYEKCISCMRCIKICPTHSRTVNKFLVTIAATKMKKACSDRKGNELFIE